MRYPSRNYWGASGLSSWTSSLLCLHGITRFCHSETWLFISLLCWWHSTIPFVPSWWSEDSCSHLSLSNIHFLLDEGPSPSTQIAKAELLVVPSNPSFHHNFTIQLGTSTITPSKTARNLGDMIDHLTFSHQISKAARSCRFSLFNVKKIRPFLSEPASQLLVQALVLSRLDYCNALLSGLPASSIKPLKLIHNAAARLIFNEPKRMHVTPLFINLHWLPIAARIKFKALMFDYKTTTGSAPLYLNPLLQTYVPSRIFRSASERRFIVPSQKGTKSLSQTLKLNVPIWWNDLPNSIRAAESLPIFKNQLKTHLFHLYLTL